MKKLMLLSVASVALSGCLVTPEQSAVLPATWRDAQTGAGVTIAISGFVPQKTWPILVRCDVRERLPVARIMPATTPQTDKNGKLAYMFSAQVTIPTQCWQYLDALIYAINPDGTKNYGQETGELQWAYAQLVYAQEITRADGTKYNSYQNVVVADKKAKECVLDQYSRKMTYASVLNNCSSLVDWNQNGAQTIRTSPTLLN